MKISRVRIISAVFVLVAVAVGVWLYPQMPAVVATHFDAQGRANGWSPRWLAASLPTFVVLGLVILTWVLPLISPRKFAIKPFARVYEGVMLAVQGAALVTGICAALKGTGYHVPLATIGTLVLGVMFMVMGNYMGKLRKNFFIGIRTPWTLASDAVWERTHRMAGWLFMLAGLVWIVLGLTGAKPWVSIGVVLAAALIPAGYSFVVYRRLEGFNQSGGENG